MRRMRFLALGIVSFVVAIVGTLLASGTFVNRAFSAALCTLFSFNWTFCSVDLGVNSQRVVAANPPAVVADISNYLQAQRDPSEFGDEPSAPSTQQSNPQAPPFPQDPGPNFPVRREFDRPDQQPNLTRTIAFNLPTIRQLSPGTFELNLVSKEGCNFITTINSIDSQIYQSSTRFAPSSVEVCGIPAFTAHLSPDGTRMEVKVDASSESVVIEKIDDNSMKAVLKSATGETQLGIFPIEELQQKGLGNLKTLTQHKQVRQFTSQRQTGGLIVQRQDTRGQAAFREATCIAGRRTCAGITLISSVATAMGLIPLPSSIPLEAIGAGAAVFGYGCFLLFGGTPPLPFLPKPISIAYDFTTGMRSLSEEREARYRLGQAPGVRSPNDNPLDIATYGDRFSGSIRKALGIDFCDPQRIAAQPTQPQQTAQKPESEPSITVTATPNQVQVNQESIIQVSFTDPACDARLVRLTSPTMTSTATVEVESESACGGTVRFGAKRVESGNYGCATYNSGFSVSVEDSAGKSFIRGSTEPILTIIGRKGYLDYRSCYPQVYKLQRR